MNGVVVWAERSNVSAIIWCDDGFNLAYVKKERTEISGMDLPEVGDLVSVDTYVENNVRYCRSLCVEQKKFGVELVSALNRVQELPQKSEDLVFGKYSLAEHMVNSIGQSLPVTANFDREPSVQPARSPRVTEQQRLFAQLRSAPLGA